MCRYLPNLAMKCLTRDAEKLEAFDQILEIAKLIEQPAEGGDTRAGSFCALVELAKSTSWWCDKTEWLLKLKPLVHPQAQEKFDQTVGRLGHKYVF